MLALVLVCACSGDGDPGAQPATATTAAPTVDPAAIVAVDGVAVRDLPEGAGVPQASAGTDLPGYVETEHLLTGTADTYTGPATEAATADGTATPYATRILVRRPADPDDVSGRVVVEPMNTSGGADLDAVWSQTSSLLMDEGDVWIGVTVRASSVGALQGFDAERYADLDLPSNDLSWDVLRQVGALAKGGEGPPPLGDLAGEHAYLVGYSQSGVDVATFASALDAVTRMADGAPVYDGYLPAAHSGSLAPLTSGTAALPSFEFEPMGPVAVPVLDVETQSDVEGFSAEVGGELGTYTSPGGASVRRPDSTSDGDLYRLVEVPGAPHAAQIPGCEGEASTFPVPAYLRAALARLYRWAEAGETPPEVERIELATDDVVSVAATDEHGNARGGLRSPFLDLPLARYEAHATPGALCALGGRQTLLATDVLVDRYGDADAYLERFIEDLDQAIEDGWLLALDRQELLATQEQLARRAFG